MNSEKLTAKNRAYLLAPVVLPYPKRVNFNYSLLTINHSLLFSCPNYPKWKPPSEAFAPIWKGRKRISLTMRMDDQPAEKAAGQRPASARKGNGGGQRQGGNKRGGGQAQSNAGGTFADLFAKAKDEQKKGKKRL